MAVWPFIVVMHEKIHHAQQKEVSILGVWLMIICNLAFGFSWWFCLIPVLLFYVIYISSYLWNLATNTQFETPKDAYKRIPFEKEAYGYQFYSQYLSIRKPYAWLFNQQYTR
jgi:predicted tellurium resistance membrane protein TerC